MDVFTSEKRSWVMSRIQGKNTKPEKIVRSILHRLGYRFRLHAKLPGRPDIVLPKHGMVIFVHGCFWHRHQGCPYAYEPKSRKEFWQEKFRGNVSRDRKNKRQLQKLGWKVVTIWECKTKNVQYLMQKIITIMKM